jgi:hypothetical protein
MVPLVTVLLTLVCGGVGIRRRLTCSIIRSKREAMTAEKRSIPRVGGGEDARRDALIGSHLLRLQRQHARRHGDSITTQLVDPPDYDDFGRRRKRSSHTSSTVAKLRCRAGVGGAHGRDQSCVWPTCSRVDAHSRQFCPQRRHGTS